MSLPKIRRRIAQDDLVTWLTASGIHSTLARIYVSRGVTSPSDLSYELNGLPSYASLLDIDKAATLLADAIRDNKSITVSCDFDVDGTTSGTVAIRGLRMLGAKRLSTAMPRRDRHGYGYGPLLVNEIHQKHSPDIVLTVDCGISSFDGVAEANRLGITTVITDHHIEGSEGVPDAFCAVNPNRVGDQFPSKNICGCAVVFYVLLATRAELRRRGAYNDKPEPNLADLLDLVALATVADVVKLDHLNRTIISHGLRRIRSRKACPGINALLRVGGKIPESATVTDLAFIVSPRLNAAGRLEDASLGLQCLLTDDPDDAAEYAKKLDELNHERRAIESDMKDAALDELDGIEVGDNFSLVMYRQDFHPGVVGILASRLKDLYGRPTIVFAPAGDGKIKGSGRSIPGLHLRDAIDLVAKRNPGICPAYGGHSQAAGLTCIEDRFDEFTQQFELVVRELIDKASLEQIIETDGELATSCMSIEFAEMINEGIWGAGFPPPLFDGIFNVLDQRVLKGKHLKLRLQAKGGSKFDAIWFFNNTPLPPEVRVAYSLDINEYNGARSVQLLVRHAEPF